MDTNPERITRPLPLRNAAESPGQEHMIDGPCARCGAINSRTKTHCSQCGARLPWIPEGGAVKELPQRPTPEPVKMWPFWAGDAQKISTFTTGLENFRPTQWCMGADKKHGIAIDERMQTICLLNVVEDQLHRRIFTYDELLGSEVVEDGYIMASTSGSVGSSLGGQGTLPQGLTRKVRTGENVQVVAFKLVLNALTNEPVPEGMGAANTLVHIVKFVCKPTTRGSSGHQRALDQAEHWHKIVLAVLHIRELKNRPLPKGL